MPDALQAVRGEGITVLVSGSRTGAPHGVSYGWVERALSDLSRERRIAHVIVLGSVGTAARATVWALRDAQIACTQFPDLPTQRDRITIHHEALACLVQMTESARRLVLWFPPSDVESDHVVATAALHSVPVWRCVGAGSRWSWEAGRHG